MNNVSVENINNLVGSLYNPIREVNRDVKSISLDGGDPILPDENKNINIPSYDGNPGLFNRSIYNELIGRIPTKLSELQNDNNYVQDSNYVHTDNNFTTSYKDKLDDTYRKSEVYNKQESYSKTEVDNKIASIVTTTFEVVDELPQQGESNVIYLLPNEQSADNEYEEYIWVNNKWELIGTTKVDLTPYYTSSQVDDLINPISNNVTLLQQNKLDKNLGADNANKHLGIDSSGNILPVNDVITTSELTGALLGEQQAREKQDDLLQGEIDTKMAPSNIIAGDNINVSQQGLDVTVSATVPKYTAGTNMEITEDGVINNTIPYKNNDTGIQLGTLTYPGYTVDTGTVAIGYPTTFIGNLSSAVSIGGNNTITSASVAVGVRANVNYANSIGIGYFAKVDKTNQFVLGSTVAPINEMKVVTSEGDKYIATKDLVKDYTAGTNIEITEQGVINNKIPYNSEAQNSVILGDINVDEGLETSNSIYIGSKGTQRVNDFYRNIIIGNSFNGISGNAIAIGHGCNSSSYSIALGHNANASSPNQCVIGGFAAYINDVYVYTSSGRKRLAFVDQIPEETPIATTELVGKVKPDGTSTTVDEDGTLHSVGVTQEYVDNAVSQLQTKITELESRIKALENANA